MRSWRLIQRGFSLVEIAIVLVVVGLIISGGLMGITPVLQGNRAIQTNEQMDKIEKALALYVIQNACLPCPADPRSVPIGSASIANAGRSRDATGFYVSGCSNAANCVNSHGLVPWVNLGLSKSDVLDGYGYFFDYALVNTDLLNRTNGMMRTPPSTYPAGTLDVNEATGATLQTSVAAYVLVSHGSDASGAFTGGQGTGGADTAAQKVDPNGSAAQTANTAGGGGGTGAGPFTASAAYRQDTPRGPAAASGFFDDIVRFKTAPVIIQSCGANACGNPAS